MECSGYQPTTTMPTATERDKSPSNGEQKKPRKRWMENVENMNFITAIAPAPFSNICSFLSGWKQCPFFFNLYLCVYFCCANSKHRWRKEKEQRKTTWLNWNERNCTEFEREYLCKQTTNGPNVILSHRFSSLHLMPVEVKWLNCFLEWKLIWFRCSNIWLFDNTTIFRANKQL